MFCNFHFSDDQSRWQLLEEGQIIAHFLGRSYDLHIYFGIFCTGWPGTTPHSAMGGVTNWLDAYLVRGPESDDSIYGSSRDLVSQQGPVLLSNLRAVVPATRHHIGRRQVDWFHQPTWGTASVHLMPYGPEAEQTRLLRYHRVTVDRYTNVATIDPPVQYRSVSMGLTTSVLKSGQSNPLRH